MIELLIHWRTGPEEIVTWDANSTADISLLELKQVPDRQIEFVEILRYIPKD